MRFGGRKTSDLIDRQAAIDAFNTGLNELVVVGEENSKMVENYLNRVIEKIKCLPSAQPKKGKWKHISDGYVDIYECDQCGKTEDYERNFCPNCGAKMEVTE